MLTYSFENIGSDSLYEYLYKCIRDDIVTGNLLAGTKLPSKRTFAKNLGISVITVEGAYEQLRAEGYIYSVVKKGFYVSDLKYALSGLDVSGERKKTKSVKTKRTEKMTQGYLADFSSNQTDSDIFPFTIWTKTIREVLSDSRIELMTNSPCGGIRELRESIAVYLKDFRGMDVKPEQIIVGAGTEYLYGLLIQLLGNRRVYAVENPGYLKIAKVYESMKVACRYIDMDAEGISVEKLEQEGADIVHISPSHHFPTGIVMPISRRYELLGWAAKKQERYIIEDDYDSELRLTGKPIPTLQSIDVAGKVIYMNTFSKTLASTVRISYMVLPQSLTREFYEQLSFYSCTVSNFEQYTLARFIENGSFEKHINRLRNYYQNKRDQILQAFQQSSLGKLISISGEETGIHFLMHIMTGKKESEIVQLAKTRGIRMVPVSDYYHAGTRKVLEDNTFVMNYASIDLEHIDRIVAILYEIITK
ncbi:PLP-dependent aminotransferase family protein [Roseburia sp. MUC/MUC-530-WT-4D]|uniref:PLP-dependent aminotransferase family protein n=1 Tax=Roseburia porci TaxID=2605790 RepID=A0A6L5YRS0_9FIRM|nr:PLP-dependent aminotransferase family protein [Roseburia porci]MCI5517612.1 PLP-dependent aminotransferase family protein [Roseburia sp.]MDD6744302.1 PLP-dependent aminotransferase family protein [Roseburia porci]MST74867.1 PLP-dependent aminotransferase family protein [Roseburia porci]